MRMVRQGRSWSGHERNCAFLNTADSTFANISAASGLDFPEDGRALAVVDWDQDGDLDLWFTNRTSPRLRLMVNRTYEPTGEDRDGFVALQLHGTTSNRDGIGARVDVQLNNPSKGPMTATLHAGDGFLSQSSKWLHFGLGREQTVESVAVHWPAGRMEVFDQVSRGGRYILLEGSGRATEWDKPRRSVNLPSSHLVPPPTTDAAHILLPARLPLPPLSYRQFGDTKLQEIDTDARPLLINLWASWCLPCIAELRSFVAHENKLRNTGLNILALSVDGLEEKHRSTPDNAWKLIGDIDFPFDSGLATTPLVNKVELIQEALFDRQPPLGVPISILLDDEGQLSAIYRGPIDLDVLIHDVTHMEATVRERRDMSVPFAGQWHSQPSGIIDFWLQRAAQSFENKYPQDSTWFVQRLVDVRTARLHLMRQGKADFALDLARDLEILAQLLILQDRSEEGIDRWRRALKLKGDDAEGHVRLGNLLMSQGRAHAAAEQYRNALQINPADIEAQRHLESVLKVKRQPVDQVP